MAMIASQCPQHEVTVVDINPERIAAWNSDQLPIFEPGLEVLVQAQRGVNLFFLPMSMRPLLLRISFF